MKIAALAGGVGGAKLAQGLAEVLDPRDLSIIVNTADDFEHLGLFISPDVDTVCYTLAGIANPATGWGLADDTFITFDAIARLGGPDWFRLGDRDLATHLERTRLLRNGKNLTEITRHVAHKLGVSQSVLPMSNDRVSTWVNTEELGMVPFQEYFVKHRYEPGCKGFFFKGAEQAKASEEVINAITGCDAVVLCPSNPFVSIDPILSLGGIREMITSKFVVCVSPIICGKAVKGPLAKMFAELGIMPSPQAVAAHYGKLVNLLMIDSQDRSIEPHDTRSSIMIHATDILIPDLSSRARLAKELIDLIQIHNSD